MRRYEKEIVSHDVFLQYRVTVVTAMTILAYRLNLDILAEGAQTDREVLSLRENGHNELRGNYYSVPLSKKAFKRFRLKRKTV